MAIAIEHIHVPLHQDQDGVIRVAGTRVTLDTVVGAFTLGASAEGIVDRYDSLSLPDVYAVIAYYLAHRAEVDGYLRDRGEYAAVVHAENERRSPTAGVRERLLARRAGRS